MSDRTSSASSGSCRLAAPTSPGPGLGACAAPASARSCAALRSALPCPCAHALPLAGAERAARASAHPPPAASAAACGWPLSLARCTLLQRACACGCRAATLPWPPVTVAGLVWLVLSPNGTRSEAAALRRHTAAMRKSSPVSQSCSLSRPRCRAQRALSAGGDIRQRRTQQRTTGDREKSHCASCTSFVSYRVCTASKYLFRQHPVHARGAALRAKTPAEPAATPSGAPTRCWSGAAAGRGSCGRPSARRAPCERPASGNCTCQCHLPHVANLFHALMAARAARAARVLALH